MHLKCAPDVSVSLRMASRSSKNSWMYKTLDGFLKADKTVDNEHT